MLKTENNHFRHRQLHAFTHIQTHTHRQTPTHTSTQYAWFSRKYKLLDLYNNGGIHIPVGKIVSTSKLQLLQLLVKHEVQLLHLLLSPAPLRLLHSTTRNTFCLRFFRFLFFLFFFITIKVCSQIQLMTVSKPHTCKHVHIHSLSTGEPPF